MRKITLFCLIMFVQVSYAQMLNDTVYKGNTYSKEIEKKAKNGDLIAQTDLALCYLFGNGIKANDGKALKWLKKGVEFNYPDALFWQGYMLEKGKVKGGSAESAWPLYESAAINGHVASQVRLAYHFKDKNDLKRAKEWFLKAAKHDNTDAQFEYAMILLDENNETEAITWLKKAADKGHPQAIEQYNIILERKRERARRDSIENARRDSIARVQQIQDSIDYATGVKLPSKSWLLKGCNVYEINTNNQVEYDIYQSVFYRQLTSLFDNDVLRFSGKTKLDDLDKSLYVKSNQYKSDLQLLEKKKGETYAITFLLSRVKQWDFFADGFKFPSYNLGPAGNYYGNLQSNYQVLLNFYIPVKSNYITSDFIMSGVKSVLIKYNNTDILQKIRALKDSLDMIYIFKVGTLISGRFDGTEFNKDYLTYPIGLYLVNHNTGETLINLSYCLRKPNLQVEKQKTEANARILYRKDKQREQKNKPKYHKQAKQLTCPICWGKGYRTEGHFNGTTFYEERERCTYCYGKGYILEHYY